MKYGVRLLVFCLLAFLTTESYADNKLTGTVIGTKECVDYANTSK